MIKTIKKFVAVILTLALALGLCVCTTVGASEEVSDTVGIASVTSSVSPYAWENGIKGSNVGANTIAPTAFDGLYNSAISWDAGTSTNGAVLDIALKALSRVSRIDIYVCKDSTWNSANRENSKYTAVPMTATKLASSGDLWTLASETEYTNEGVLSEAIYADTDMSATCTADDLNVISVDIDDILCNKLSLTLAAVGSNADHDVEGGTTRMCVAEIVVYGEELTDALRNNGEAACTVELNKPAGADNKEEYLLNDDTGLTGGDIKRLLLDRPEIGEKETELIFRLDGVYNISAFRANEYWQSKYQKQATFDDVDLYIGNTTGASTQWTQIADGINFKIATAAGHSENIMCGNASVTGDSFKMVINGTEHDTTQEYTNDAGESKTLSLTSNALTDVALYGTKVSTEHGGSTMRICPVTSYVGDAEYACVVKTADKIVLTPEYSGTAPSVVAAAAYNATGELIGVALGNSGEEITLNIKSGSEVSFIKLFGWDSTNTPAPISTTYTRYGVGAK